MDRQEARLVAVRGVTGLVGERTLHSHSNRATQSEERRSGLKETRSTSAAPRTSSAALASAALVSAALASVALASAALASAALASASSASSALVALASAAESTDVSRCCSAHDRPGWNSP
eukprot:1089426-Prymnesium_polylepis.1